ncbi:MAG: hypothetical protein KJ804_04160 [Proteobacteria bacterium]|nr:hypothetical protein [Pseudomonadota bacterium]
MDSQFISVTPSLFRGDNLLYSIELLYLTGHYLLSVFFLIPRSPQMAVLPKESINQKGMIECIAKIPAED